MWCVVGGVHGCVCGVVPGEVYGVVPGMYVVCRAW